jgi:DNA-binding protein YbaB
LKKENVKKMKNGIQKKKNAFLKKIINVKMMNFIIKILINVKNNVKEEM